MTKGTKLLSILIIIFAALVVLVYFALTSSVKDFLTPAPELPDERPTDLEVTLYSDAGMLYEGYSYSITSEGLTAQIWSDQAADGNPIENNYTITLTNSDLDEVYSSLVGYNADLMKDHEREHVIMDYSSNKLTITWNDNKIELSESPYIGIDEKYLINFIDLTIELETFIENKLGQQEN